MVVKKLKAKNESVYIFWDLGSAAVFKIIVNCFIMANNTVAVKLIAKNEFESKLILQYLIWYPVL